MIQVTLKGVDDIFVELKKIDDRMLPDFIALATKETYKNVKNRAKKHHVTGNMEDNISFKVSKRNLHGEVYIDNNAMLSKYKGKDVNYALFVLYGTKQHDILPKNKKRLRFASVSEFAYSKKVKHPGYKGDNFLKHGVEDTLKNIDKLFQKVNNEFR